MTVSIELSDEQVVTLTAKAAAEGLSLESWFQKVAAVEGAMAQTSRKSRYSLSALLEQCDAMAPLSSEDIKWMNLPAVGREA